MCVCVRARASAPVSSALTAVVIRSSATAGVIEAILAALLLVSPSGMLAHSPHFFESGVVRACPVKDTPLPFWGIITLGRKAFLCDEPVQRPSATSEILSGRANIVNDVGLFPLSFLFFFFFLVPFFFSTCVSGTLVECSRKTPTIVKSRVNSGFTANEKVTVSGYRSRNSVLSAVRYR